MSNWTPVRLPLPEIKLSNLTLSYIILSLAIQKGKDFPIGETAGEDNQDANSKNYNNNCNNNCNNNYNNDYNDNYNNYDNNYDN